MQRTTRVTLPLCALSVVMMLGLNVLARPQAAQQPAPSPAAPQVPPGRRAIDERMERLSKALDLTQEQRDKIRPLIEAEAKQMRELRENTSLPMEQRREKARAMIKETHEKIEAVLSAEQKEKLKQHMEQMRQGRAAEQKEPPAKQ